MESKRIRLDSGRQYWTTLLFPRVYAAVGVFGTQKGDNFRVMDRVFIGPFDITAVSQYLWAQVSGRVGAMDWLQALYFFFSPLLAQNAAFASLAS